MLIAVQIATGGIATNFLENLETLHLSETSLYYAGRSTLKPIMNYEGQKSAENSMPPPEFVQQVYDAATTGVSKDRVYAAHKPC